MSAKMTDAVVQSIVDAHAPSQGEPWDMAAMLREAFAAGMDRAAMICHCRAVDQRIHPLAGKGALDCRDAIRAELAAPPAGSSQE